MNTPDPLQLIHGTFAPEDASRILLSLVKSKMDYHGMEKHSNRERLGGDPSHSERRLEELAALQVRIQELVAAAAAAGQSLEINGWIEITLVDPGKDIVSPRSTAGPSHA